MQNKKLELLIKQIEGDKELLKIYFGSDKQLSSGELNKLGVLMEQGGKDFVEIRLKAIGSSDFLNIEPYRKVYEYVLQLDALQIPAAMKGYILKKLDAIATIKIGRD